MLGKSPFILEDYQNSILLHLAWNIARPMRWVDTYIKIYMYTHKPSCFDGLYKVFSLIMAHLRRIPTMLNNKKTHVPFRTYNKIFIFIYIHIIDEY